MCTYVLNIDLKGERPLSPWCAFDLAAQNYIQIFVIIERTHNAKSRFTGIIRSIVVKTNSQSLDRLDRSRARMIAKENLLTQLLQRRRKKGQSEREKMPRSLDRAKISRLKM